MLQQGLKINWNHTVEYIPIDPINVNENTSVLWTIESWPASGKGDKATCVFYVVTASTVRRDGEEIELRLRYRLDDQTDDRVKAVEYWGESLIKWRASANAGKAYWTDDTNDDANGWVDVEILLPAERSRESVDRNARPEQHNLRNALLAMDGKCAVSGETQPDALEAAHIKAVRDGGVECPTNAILLRADLHRLFDAELISLDVVRGRAVVRCDERVSRGYEAFNGAKLPDSVFQRIAPRLAGN